MDIGIKRKILVQKFQIHTQFSHKTHFPQACRGAPRTAWNPAQVCREHGHSCSSRTQGGGTRCAHCRRVTAEFRKHLPASRGEGSPSSHTPVPRLCRRRPRLPATPRGPEDRARCVLLPATSPAASSTFAELTGSTPRPDSASRQPRCTALFTSTRLLQVTPHGIRAISRRTLGTRTCAGEARAPAVR